MNTNMIQPKLTEMLEGKSKTLYWLAQKTGVAYSTLHRLGRARAQSVDFRVLDSICEALDCEPGDLLSRVRETESRVGKKASAKKKGK